MHELAQLKEQFNKNGIMICFNGPFSQSIIEEIGKAVKTHLEREKIRKDAMLDVFAVYIEQMQNVKNYLSRTGYPAEVHDSAIMTIGRRDGRYVITSGNLTEKSDTAGVTRWIDTIKGLDDEGLKSLYKERIRKSHPPGARGAGVGLIDMARRASNRLSYVVEHIDDVFDFFILTAEI
ncbi:MAG: SiaB family protein kinase [Desulfobacteraceae bacterium]|nr:SiaB family protein kinase [Desulfobacteraceae bacterium]